MRDSEGNPSEIEREGFTLLDAPSGSEPQALTPSNIKFLRSLTVPSAPSWPTHVLDARHAYFHRTNQANTTGQPHKARSQGLVPLFNNAHARGRDAEAQLLQDLLNDPSVEFHYDELKPDGTTSVRAFRSRDEGYRVFWVIRGHRVRAGISITDIRVVDGTRRLTIEDFIAERATAAAPAAAAP